MPLKRMTERARSKSLGISLTCKRVLRRMLVVFSMPKKTRPKRIDQESSLTFVDWLLAIDLDPFKTGPGNRDE
jgi:hypothetical protein